MELFIVILLIGKRDKKYGSKGNCSLKKSELKEMFFNKSKTKSKIWLFRVSQVQN